jgi:hypothetical protein
MEITGVEPPAEGPICSDCSSSPSTMCFSFNQNHARDSDGDLVDCTWGAQYSMTYFCNTGSWGDYLLTFAEVSGEVIATVTTGGGGVFTFNLGTNPDCCDFNVTGTIDVEPSMDCDFSGATVTLFNDNYCNHCGQGINYIYTFTPYAVAEPAVECGCHDGCENLNGRVLAGGGVFTDFDPPENSFGTGRCINCEWKGKFGCEKRTDYACGHWRYWSHVSYDPPQYDPEVSNNWTGAVEVEIYFYISSGCYIGGVLPSDIPDYQDGHRKATFYGTVTVPDYFMPQSWNRAYEWIRLNPLWLDSLGYLDHAYPDEAYSEEHYCDIESARVLFQMHFGSDCAETDPNNDCDYFGGAISCPDANMPCTHEKSYPGGGGYCNSNDIGNMWCHGDREVDIEVTIPAVGTIPAGTYVFDGTGLSNCFWRREVWVEDATAIEMAVSWCPTADPNVTDPMSCKYLRYDSTQANPPGISPGGVWAPGAVLFTVSVTDTTTYAFWQSADFQKLDSGERCTDVLAIERPLDCSVEVTYTLSNSDASDAGGPLPDPSPATVHWEP